MAKKQFASIGLLVAAVAFAVSSLCFPALALLTVFGSMVCFAMAIIVSPNLWVVGAGSILTLLVAWVVSGSVSAALLFVLLFLPVGSAIGLGFCQKKGFNEVIGFSALGSALMGVLWLLVFIGEFSGGSFDVTEVLTPIFQEAKYQLLAAFSSADPSLNSMFEVYGLSVEQYVKVIYQSVVYNIPTFFMGFMLGLSVLCYWTVKAIMKRTEIPVDFMGRFSECRMSYTGAVVYFIVTILYLFTSNSAFGIAISNFSNIMTYVFAYAGISLLSFFLEFKNISSFFKACILVIACAVCLLPTGILNLVALVGIVDAYWNIREKLKNSGF